MKTNHYNSHLKTSHNNSHLNTSHNNNHFNTPASHNSQKSITHYHTHIHYINNTHHTLNNNYRLATMCSHIRVTRLRTTKCPSSIHRGCNLMSFVPVIGHRSIRLSTARKPTIHQTKQAGAEAETGRRFSPHHRICAEGEGGWLRQIS